MKEIKLKGIASSPGINSGSAYIISQEPDLLPAIEQPTATAQEEIKRMEAAISYVLDEFKMILEKVNKDFANVGSILESNIYILSDTFLIESIYSRINSGSSAEAALVDEFDTQTQYMRKAATTLLRERAMEFDNIKSRLLAALHNQCLFISVPKGSVIIAKSITPTDLVRFREYEIVGLITEIGGISSHTSILARSFEIPSVIGVKNLLDHIKNSDQVIVDGYSGVLTINPENNSIKEFLIRKRKEDAHKKKLGALIKLPGTTKDNHKIHLRANIDTLDDIESAVFVGAEGIGLVRTENLILTLHHFPTEEEQFNWYKEIADRMYPHNVIFRAFDIGSDKYSEGLLKHENNPALGCRGVRFLLQRKDIFTAQIKAILRASYNKNVMLMLPMITNNDEVILCKELIEQCKELLKKENVEFDSKLKVGIMIETPSAALLADSLAEQSDFFSIGTNDLTQYTLATDRTNETVAYIYNAVHPAVLKLIKSVAFAAGKKKIPVGICGDLSAHPAATKLLIGIGITELSVTPPVLLELKKRVRETNSKSAKRFANKILKLCTVDEISKELQLK